MADYLVLMRIIYGLLVILIFAGNPAEIDAQVWESETYELRMGPDLWYNSVDGPQVGMTGQLRQFGRITEGPHYLRAGFLLGTNYPDITFNYSVNYRHTLSTVRGVERTGMDLTSQYRNGFQQHGFGFNRNIGASGDRSAGRISSDFYIHQLYDDRYRIFPRAWRDGWSDMIRVQASYHNWGDWHRSSAIILDARISPGAMDHDAFSRIELSAQERLALFRGFNLNLKAYGGWFSDQTPDEYLPGPAGAALIDLQQSRFTRARGTLPPSWFRNGAIHTGGGPNLRGFQERESEFRSTPEEATGPGSDWFTQTEALGSLNAELEIPNPLNRQLRSLPVAGEFIRFSSYLFTDAGVISRREASTYMLADGGAGFELSVNLPDYLGRKRGFQLRFDIPFWYYDSLEDTYSFEVKPLLGVGSIYHF